jgi:hypothetical protein
MKTTHLLTRVLHKIDPSKMSGNFRSFYEFLGISGISKTKKKD